MIGLIDLDFYSSTATDCLIPNVDIMKLATYYRIEKNTFCRLISLFETELEGYDKIYCFSESEEPIKVPEQFLRAQNIVFGGTGFTKEYIPFENEIIDFTIPKPTIYKDILKQKYNDGIKSKVINHVLDDTYYRMFAGNKILPIPPIMKGKRIFLFDKELFKDGWEEQLNKIARRKPSSIIPIHPIRCKKIKQYFSIRESSIITRNAEVILDLNIPLDEIHYMLKNYTNRFLADLVPSSRVYITLGGDFRYNKQYIDDYVYKLNLLYSFWSKGIPMKIKYITPSIGFNDPIVELSQLTAKWSRQSGMKGERTLNDRLPISKTTKPTKQRIEKNLLLEQHPNARELFNQDYNKLKTEGRWRV